MSKNTDQSNFNNLQELLEVIISLQGRQIFPNDKLCQMVTEKKQNPENYIKVYNSCDGEHSVSDLAELASVKQPTMTEVLQNWEEHGIIFEIKKKGGKFYKNLYKLELPKNHKQKKKNDKEKSSENTPSVEMNTSEETQNV